MKAACRLPLLLIPLAAMVAILPLAIHGPSYGHDINFHLLNWMEAARQFSAGTFHLHWAYSPAYDAGEPRFVFYPPLSWTLGALLGLALNHIPLVTSEFAWTAAPIVFIWICLTLSGLTMYRAARAFAEGNAALLASTLYLTNPYMLFTAYERAAYAELLAAAWMPLLLLALLAPQVRLTRVAVPVALLWLTNAPAAVIGCYIVAIFAIFRLAPAVRARISSPTNWLREVAAPIVGVALGAGLASWYLIPAAYERRFVQVAMATAGGMRIDQNFLFEHTGTSSDALAHDAVLRTASRVALVLVIASALLLVTIRKANQTTTNEQQADATRPLPVTSLLCILGLLAFLLTAWSNPLWQHLPELPFLQFPWRFLLAITPIGALAAAAALSRFRLTIFAASSAALAAAAILTACSYVTFHQIADEDETAAAVLHSFQQKQGANPTDEYTPLTADNDALTPGHAAYWLSDVPDASGPVNPAPAPTPGHFSVATPRPEFLILNLRNYPAWQVLLNGEVQPAREQRNDGLIALPIPSGVSSIDLRYRNLPDDPFGYGVSVVSVLALGTALAGERRSTIGQGSVRGTSGANSPDPGEYANNSPA